MISRIKMVRGQRGFTLVELLITVVIIAILTAIAIPAYISVVSSAQDSAAKQSLSSAMAAEDIYTTAAATAGTFTDMAGLSTAGLITFTDPSKIQVASGNGCFIVAALSATGKIFYATDKNRNPTTTDPGTGCATLPPFPGVPDLSNILAYTIDTTAPGCGLSYQSPIGYGSGTVDWGDGSSVQTMTKYPAHAYATQGVYNIKVTGQVGTFGGSWADSAQCTTAVTRWGQGTGTVSTSYAFYNATLLTSVVPPPPTVTDMSYMFWGATAFNQPLTFNTAAVTNMVGMFGSARAFNQPLAFNTAAVTNMVGMFQSARAFNQPVAFNTAAVTDMVYMFQGATAFNQPVAFNTAAVTDMHGMFSSATAFNQQVAFDTAAVTNMNNMFASATAFNQQVAFDTAAVTNMNNMFANATAFNQPVAFNTAAVTDMVSMFQGAGTFNQPLTFSSTAAVTDMSYMFDSATVFNQYIKSWNVAAVTASTSFRVNSALTTANSPF